MKVGSWTEWIEVCIGFILLWYGFTWYRLTWRGVLQNVFSITLQSPVVNICTNCCDVKETAFFPCIESVCFIWLSQLKRVSIVHRSEQVGTIHLWRYSTFRALASLIRRLHSSLFVALLLHPLIPSSCSAFLWTTSAHLVLGLPTGLWYGSFRLELFFFGILSSSILIIWPAHSFLLILMSSTIFGSLYKLWSSLFHLGCQHPPLMCWAIYSLQYFPFRRV